MAPFFFQGHVQLQVKVSWPGARSPQSVIWKPPPYLLRMRTFLSPTLHLPPYCMIGLIAENVRNYRSKGHLDLESPTIVRDLWRSSCVTPSFSGWENRGPVNSAKCLVPGHSASSRRHWTFRILACVFLFQWRCWSTLKNKNKSQVLVWFRLQRAEFTPFEFKQKGICWRALKLTRTSKRF